MKPAEDHFSSIALQYAKGRLGYPKELYRFVASLCLKRDLAWDCATGNGQAAVDLARHFSRVMATDISQELLALAPPDPRIAYRIAPAEASGIDSDSVDLVAVAQALHWFDLERFWTETSRVLTPGGILAFWGYTWPDVDDGVNAILESFKTTIASAWPDRLRLLHDGYRTVRPPWPEIAAPAFRMSALWQANDYLAHLRSWSAVRYHRERTGEDAPERIRAALAEAWGGGPRAVTWPLLLRVFRRP